MSILFSGQQLTDVFLLQKSMVFFVFCSFLGIFVSRQEMSNSVSFFLFCFSIQRFLIEGNFNKALIPGIQNWVNDVLTFR